MDEVLAYLKANPTYFLATVDEKGDPQVRPFGTIAKFEGKLYIQTGKVKAVSYQMLAHPRVALCAMGADGTWLRVMRPTGRAMPRAWTRALAAGHALDMLRRALQGLAVAESRK